MTGVAMTSDLFSQAESRPDSKVASDRSAAVVKRASRIAVTAPKGGVGKTFITCNLAFYLHQSKMQVKPCVIDFGAESPACRWLDGKVFRERRHLHEDFVFETQTGLVVARCEDWDKLSPESKKREAFREIMANPLSNSPLVRRQLEGHEAMLSCDRFIYDTDHYIRTFIKYLTSFDRILIVFDADDVIGMENLAESWRLYSNSAFGKLLSRKPRRTYILANKAKSPEQAKGKLLKACRRVLATESMDDRDRMLAEISDFFIADLAVPRYTTNQATKAFQNSVPMWDNVSGAWDVFGGIAKLVRK